MSAGAPLFGLHQTRNAAQTVALGARLAHTLRPGAFVALEGELGAGKTQFVRGLAQGLGLRTDTVSSPTFVIVNEYDRAADTGGARCPLVHVDAYRLGGAEDLDALGWERLIDGSAVLAVEWPGRIAGRLPARRIEVVIEHAGGDTRRIRITRVGEAPAPCRTCGAELPVGAEGPFCSSRCRMADLGKWMSGAYTISRELKDADLDEG